MPCNQDDTKLGNRNNILISPKAQRLANFTKTDFEIMAEAVNRPNWEQFGTDRQTDVRALLLSFYPQDGLSFSVNPIAPGIGNASAYSGLRALSKAASPPTTSSPSSTSGASPVRTTTACAPTSVAGTAPAASNVAGAGVGIGAS